LSSRPNRETHAANHDQTRRRKATRRAGNGAPRRGRGELQPVTGLGLSALSQHLGVLRELALVATRRDAQTIHYSLADGPAVAILQTLHAIYCGDGRARR
jgi:DNA-binding transcriptional ArsR family regulator